MNPLSKFTKVPTVYVRLSSSGVYSYPEDVLKTSSTELGVCARSARDELMFNNPDALMNGEAVVEVIKNNVLGVKDPNRMYIGDVEQLLIAIKVATKESTYSVESTCPNCEKHGSFERDLQNLLDTAEPIKEIPVLVLEELGLVLKFRPLMWGERSTFSQEMFYCHKRAALLEKNTDLSDEEKISEFSAIFDKMTEISFNMMVCNIMSIETPQTEDSESEVITNADFIKEWLGQQPKFILEKIKNSTEELNNSGISHSMGVECSDCHHVWDLDNLFYDPSDFFVQNFSSLNQKK